MTKKFDDSDVPYEGISIEVEPIEATWTRTMFEDEQPPGPTFRSCWECNSAHEHMKQVAWLVCFSCGQTFRFGAKQPDDGQAEQVKAAFDAKKVFGK